MSDTGRFQDLVELQRILPRARNQAERNGILRSISAIKNETGAIRSMREKLIKAHRNKDMEEIKDIHRWVETHANYRNGLH